MKSPYNKSTRKKDVRAYDINPRKFWSSADVRGKDDCWLWMRGKNTTGYGLFNVKTLPDDFERTGRSRTQLVAHRVAYALTHPSIDASFYVCHTCDNPACVNPAHLWLGSAQDNVDDMITKNRGFWQK